MQLNDDVGVACLPSIVAIFILNREGRTTKQKKAMEKYVDKIRVYIFIGTHAYASFTYNVQPTPLSPGHPAHVTSYTDKRVKPWSTPYIYCRAPGTTQFERQKGNEQSSGQQLHWSHRDNAVIYIGQHHPCMLVG